MSVCVCVHTQTFHTCVSFVGAHLWLLLPFPKYTSIQLHSVAHKMYAINMNMNTINFDGDNGIAYHLLVVHLIVIPLTYTQQHTRSLEYIQRIGYTLC